MTNKIYGIYSVKSVRKVFESSDGSHLTSAAYEYEKGELVRITSIPEEMAEGFNAQSHNSNVRYYEITEAEKVEAETPKKRKR